MDRSGVRRPPAEVTTIRRSYLREPKDFESRGGGRSDPYIAAWRELHKALVAGGVYVGGEPLKDAGRRPPCG